jgi:hypothetical protein
MPRRLFVLLLAALAVLAFGVSNAAATKFETTYWDVSIDGKQTVKWSFAAEKSSTCGVYLGTPSEEATGSGSISMSFATKKKQPLWAETSLTGNKLRFSSFSTDGWKIPAVFTKKGKFSVTPGMPCDSDPGDPPTLPRTSDDSECGTVNTTMDPSLTWERGKFQLSGGIDPVFMPERCPGPFELEMWVDYDEHPACLPQEGMSGISGSPLQEFTVGVSSREFFKGEKFEVDANEKWQCELPSRWEGKPPLKLLLQVRYEVTFKPTKHF